MKTSTLLTFAAIVVMFFSFLTGTTATSSYNILADINDDGKIDIKDVAYVAIRFGELGIPINKTALLLYFNETVGELNASIVQLQLEVGNLEAEVIALGSNVTLIRADVDEIMMDIAGIKFDLADLNASVADLQSRVATNEGNIISLATSFLELQTRVDSLNASVVTLESEVSFLQTKVAYLEDYMTTLNDTLTQRINNLEANMHEMNATILELEDKIIILNATKFGIPDYDSDWTSIAAIGDNPPFEHDLGTIDVVVYVVGKKTLGGAHHQICYGGDRSGFNYEGVYWHKLTTTEITVHRHGQDNEWEYVRVIIWKLP